MNSDSKELLNTIHEQFIVAVIDADRVIIEANQAFCLATQYAQSELIGQHVMILQSQQHDDAFYDAMWKALMLGKTWRGHICHRCKDGSFYWVDSVLTPFRNQRGHIEKVISIERDITKSKEQEQELVKSKLLLDRTGATAGVGGWELNLLTKELYWSKETRVIHGVDDSYEPNLEEAINFYAPEARGTIEAAVARGIEFGDGWDIEVPFIRANGERIWVRAVGVVEFVNGKAVRLNGSFQDITARYIQKQVIEKANLRMSLATDSGGIGVWEYDLQSDNLIWDERMYLLYGLSPNNDFETYELWSSHLHPDDKQKAEKEFKAAINGSVKFDTEFRIVWNDGSVHHIRGAAQVERDQQGQAVKVTGVNWDVTNVHNMTKEIEEQRKLLQVTLDSIGDAVITTNADGNVEWLNPVAQRMTGWDLEAAKGKPVGHIFHIINEETRIRTENPVFTCLDQKKTVGLANHTVLISKTGEEFGIEDSASPIRNGNGDVLGVVLVFHDVTEQRRLSGEMKYRAFHDPLTGLLNRTEFEVRLKRLLNACHSDLSIHSLLFLDLDQFKIVNDTCGHSAGDQALKRVSSIFQEEIRSRDMLARLGGDEFGVVLEYCDSDQAKRVASVICEKMESFRFTHEDRKFRIGVSIGLVTIDSEWKSTTSIMQAADKACYAAKEAGRNRVHSYSDMDKAIRTRHGELQWTTRIEKALDDNRFSFHYQELKHLQQKSTAIYAEILLRMIDENGELVMPGAFLPAAERFHLISRIDKWVIKNIVTWISSLSENALSEIGMLSINLSGQSIGDRAFHDFTCIQLKKLSRANRQILCFEITETAAITNFDDASLFIERLKALGAVVALDDFGAGAASFGYLKKLDIDILKIDGQFVQGLLKEPLDEAAVKCFVEVAKVVNLKTIAEFVDDENILAKVESLGIDMAQGFLIHKPENIRNINFNT